jgi:hypothetical protein
LADVDADQLTNASVESLMEVVKYLRQEKQSAAEIAAASKDELIRIRARLEAQLKEMEMMRVQLEQAQREAKVCRNWKVD